MKTGLSLSALLLLGLAGAAAPASAMPVAPLSGAANVVTEVADGCGPGYRADSYGRCVPYRAPPPRYYRPPPPPYGYAPPPPPPPPYYRY